MNCAMHTRGSIGEACEMMFSLLRIPLPPPGDNDHVKRTNKQTTLAAVARDAIWRTDGEKPGGCPSM